MFRFRFWPLVLACALALPARAEEKASQDFSARAFPLRHIAPDILAFWLDPKNNPEPAIFRQTRELQGNSKVQSSSVFELPEGVKGVFPLMGDKQILAVGTPESLAQMPAIFAALNRRIRQIEIETHWVSLEKATSQLFGLEFKPEEKTPQIGVVRGNFLATLNALTRDGRAKSERAPRVTALNNFAVSIGFSNPETPTLVVTPTINGDDTVTLMFSVRSSETPNSTGVQSVANVRDGEALAVRSFTKPSTTTKKRGAPLLEEFPVGIGLFRSQSASDSETEQLLIITPRIVRHVDDEVPGT